MTKSKNDARFTSQFDDYGLEEWQINEDLVCETMTVWNSSMKLEILDYGLPIAEPNSVKEKNQPTHLKPDLTHSDEKDRDNPQLKSPYILVK